MENAAPPPTPPPPQPFPSPMPPNPNAERTWAMWCHLSALSGLIVPLGSILGPVIIWQIKRDQFPSLDEHGKEALNFQLSALIYLLVGGVITAVGIFFCFGVFFIPVLIAIYLAALIFPIIAGIKANDGILFRYPLTLRLIN